MGSFAAGGLRAEPDRQHRAGGLRRVGHAGDHLGQGARLRPDGSDGDDRPAVALLQPAGALLADLGICRAQGDVGYLAGDSGDRPVVRDPAVPGQQFHRAGAGRHHRGHRLDGGSGPVPAGLATQDDLDLAHHARPRHQCQRSQATPPARRACPRRPGSRLDALGDLDGVRVRLGSAAGEELSQRSVRAQVPDRRPAQPDHEGASRGADGPPRGCRLHAQSAVGHRHWHPGRSRDRRARHEVRHPGDRALRTSVPSGWCAIHC